MNREYHKWFSPALQRNMELLIFGYGGKAVLFFPTRMARFYDYENFGVVNSLKDRIEKGELQLFCVDSVDSESFYNQAVPPPERISRHLKYEHYILKEVLALMRQKNKGNDFIIAGCSMGAYHAVNIAMKYPWIFKKVVGMSGRYDVTRQIKNFKDLFDGFTDKSVCQNMPLQYVTALKDLRMLDAIRGMEIIIAVGKLDPFLQSNQEFSDLLKSKNISHNLYLWDNYAHRPLYWQKMVQLYF